MTDDFAAVNVCFHLAVAKRVAVAWPLIGVLSSWQLHPVASHDLMINHEAQGKQHIALICCEAA